MKTQKGKDRLVYQGHIKLVKRPYGGKDYDVIVSKNAAIILYIDEKDMVYFVKQFRPAIGKEVLSLAAETLDKPGLSPLEVIVEGLEEECGIRIKKEQVESHGYLYSSEGHDSEKVYLFSARGKGEYVSQKLGEFEKIKVIKIPFYKAFQMAMKNQIHGAKTTQLLMYEFLRRHNSKEK